jgi:phosphohistidine phosphatase
MSESNESTERFLLLVRHGIAEERTEAKRDFDRSLTVDGQAKMKEISKAVGKLLPKAQLILSSPYVRAAQTALFLSKSFENQMEVRTSELLAPESTRSAFRKLLEETTERRLIIVGHEPNLTEAMLELTGMKCGMMELKKGGCYGIALDSTGHGTLEWLLPPRVLRKM